MRKEGLVGREGTNGGRKEGKLLREVRKGEGEDE